MNKHIINCLVCINSFVFWVLINLCLVYIVVILVKYYFKFSGDIDIKKHMIINNLYRFTFESIIISLFVVFVVESLGLKNITISTYIYFYKIILNILILYHIKYVRDVFKIIKKNSFYKELRDDCDKEKIINSLIDIIEEYKVYVKFMKSRELR